MIFLSLLFDIPESSGDASRIDSPLSQMDKKTSYDSCIGQLNIKYSKGGSNISQLSKSKIAD